MICSYCLAEAYPRANLGRPDGLNCEATRAVDLNACILYVINCILSEETIGKIEDYMLMSSSQALMGSNGEPRLCLPQHVSRLQLPTSAVCALAYLAASAAAGMLLDV
jgi:hypothetical protein